MKRQTPIRVILWGEEVGLVHPSSVNPGLFVFRYSSEWLKSASESGLSPAPLTMPITPTPYSFSGLRKETFHGLPGMIADAMPDRFGNAVIDAHMSKRGIFPDRVTILQRLAYIGRRAMGALEFEPADEDAHANSEYRDPLIMRDLVESARAAIQGKIPDVHDALIEIGSSAGGARAKAVVGYNHRTEEIVSGQLGIPDEFAHYLLKFDGVEGVEGVYGRRESAYLSMARSAGIDTPEHFLIESGDRAHLMIKRFDRTGGGDKLHMQTLCGLSHMDFNVRSVNEYSAFFRTMSAIGLGVDAIEEGFRRMVFNVAAVNRDDHTKNQSFLMTPEGRWSLAPAYDIGFAWNPNPDNWTHQHQMLVNGKGDQIHLSDLIATGEITGLPLSRMESIIQDVMTAIDDWPAFAEKAGMQGGDMARIREHHQKSMRELDDQDNKSQGTAGLFKKGISGRPSM